MDQRFIGLAHARADIRAANDRLNAFLKASWPVGTAIRWRADNHHIQEGIVVGHGWKDGMSVRNLKTGATVRIDSYDVLMAEPEAVKA